MKRLIVCFDGTWNAADSEKAETNVARLARSIRGNSGDTQQMVLYLRGVGTSGNKIEKLLAGATGSGVGDNIRSAYMFLAQNYRPAEPKENRLADEIYLFGFSRGAFSARSLSGLIRSCGILKRYNLNDVDKAWRYYRDTKKRSPDDFAKKHKLSGINLPHQDVEIKFLGVWDTVGALGVPVGFLGQISDEIFEFHDTEPSSIVRYGAHALAIDEHRDEFVPTLWTGKAPANSVIEQVWFAGCHSDVGGGYDDRELADIPLHWMAKTAEKQGLSLDWETGGLPPENGTLDPLAPTHDSRDGWLPTDRVFPTIRRVAQKPVDVKPWEKEYFPHKNSVALPTIGERIHESLALRYGRKAFISPDDKKSRRKKELYVPKNLKPHFP